MRDQPYLGRVAKMHDEVRLNPPIYVRPFVKRQKNDSADAAAIAEAGARTSRAAAVSAPANRRSRASADRRGVVPLHRPAALLAVLKLVSLSINPEVSRSIESKQAADMWKEQRPRVATRKYASAFFLVSMPYFLQKCD